MLCDFHPTGVKTEAQNSFKLPARKAEPGILSFPATPDLVSQAAAPYPRNIMTYHARRQSSGPRWTQGPYGRLDLPTRQY